jgi:hypothetical protein
MSAMDKAFQSLQGWRERLQGPSWAEALDFAGPRVRTATWSWAVLGAGVLALLVVADQGEAQHQAIDEAQGQLKRLSRADRALRLERAAKAELRHDLPLAKASAGAADASASAPPVPAAPRLNDQTLPEAVNMAALMAYPWPQVLREVSQRAMDHRVVLMALSLDLSGWDAGAAPVPTARLLAAVPSDEVALRWAADLPDGQIKTRSVLQTPFSSLWGSFAHKAEVQARWAPGSQP